MKIRVGFSTTNSIFSKIICWFIDDDVSHSYICFYDEFLEEHLVMHADWPGVIIEPLALFDATNTIVEEYIINDPRLKASLTYNLRHLRKKYDYWNIAYKAWAITFKRWITRKVKKPTENPTKPTKMICVDFVLYVLNRASICDLPYGELNPKDFRKWMRENAEANGWKIDKKEVK